MIPTSTAATAPTPQTTPTTIPAIAPPESPELFFFFEFTASPVPDADAEADSVDVVVVASVCDDDDVVGDEVLDDSASVLDDVGELVVVLLLEGISVDETVELEDGWLVAVELELVCVSVWVELGSAEVVEETTSEVEELKLELSCELEVVVAELDSAVDEDVAEEEDSVDSEDSEDSVLVLVLCGA